MDKTNVMVLAEAKNKGAIFHTDLQTGAFHAVADEPVAYGGGATDPSPVDYLCMALASCKAITVHIYATAKAGNGRRWL